MAVDLYWVFLFRFKSELGSRIQASRKMEICDSLDCRLKVSGMVADSIMMGIVNSAMEEAYMKVCSKEGDLECLNEKSRFCELALMQLDWCLKFMQEEVDSYIVESSRERENLVFDLTTARDRMQKRLEETLLAIAEKDKELTERLENESQLRQALELKEEELSTLRATLELERTKCERVREFVLSNPIRKSNDRSYDFFSVKSSMDQKFWNIKQKIEDGLVNLTDGIHTDESCDDPLRLERAALEPPSNLADEGNCKLTDMCFGTKSEEVHGNDGNSYGLFGHDFNSENEVLNSYPRVELNMVIQQMGVDIDILKDMLELAFEMMDHAVCSSKLALMEEQWKQDLERETVALVTKSFIREVQENFGMKFSDRQYGHPQCFASADWEALMDELKILRHELEALDIQDKVQSTCAASRGFGRPPQKHIHADALQRSGKSDSALKLEQLSLRGIPEQDSITQPDHSDAEAIQNHEPSLKNIIPKKEKSANILRRCGMSDTALMYGELFHSGDTQKEERSGYSHHYVAKMIRNHEDIIKKKTEEINWLRGEIFREKWRPPRRSKDIDAENQSIPKVISRLDHIIKESGKLYVTTDLREKVRKAEQDREDLVLQAVVMTETWAILFRGLVEDFRLKLDSRMVEDLVRDDISTVFLREIVREGNTEIERSNFDGLISEEVCKTVLSEVVKDFQCHFSSDFGMCQEAMDRDIFIENLPSTSDPSQLWEDLVSDESSQPAQWDTKQELEDLNGMLNENDDAFFSVSSKLEKALQQITASKEQLEELSSSFSITAGVWEEAHGQMFSHDRIVQDGDPTKCLANAVNQQILFDSFIAPLSDFTKGIKDFELMINERLGVFIMRLEDVNSDFSSLIKLVSSLRRNELVYRKAFTRRCYDLQTAEAEVDLLGDEVDSLLRLLEKIYVALYHYSPVLQLDPEIFGSEAG
ncbi:hypothetical protein ACLOJK_009314 [Asimina triloba]